MTIVIKEWMASKIDIEAKRYNTFCDTERDDMGISIKGRYINAEILKETEKAVQVKLSSGDVVGSYKGWTTWCPKSAIVEIIK